MEKVKVFYDRAGNTLTLWFGNPDDEHVVEETADEVLLIKDRDGNVIGFEKLNFSRATADELSVIVQTSGGE